MSDPTARAQREAADRQATRDQNRATRLDLDRVARQHREALAAHYEQQRARSAVASTQRITHAW